MISAITIQILQAGVGAVIGALLVAMIRVHEAWSKPFVRLTLIAALVTTVLLTASEFLNRWSGVAAQDPSQALVQLLTALPFLVAALMSGFAAFALTPEPMVEMRLRVRAGVEDDEEPV